MTVPQPIELTGFGLGAMAVYRNQAGYIGEQNHRSLQLHKPCGCTLIPHPVQRAGN